MASEGGGTYTLAQASDDAEGRGSASERHVLTLHEIDGRVPARIAAAMGAVLGALCAGGLAVALLPVHGAPDGLTPTRGDYWLEAFVAGGALGALLGGFAAHAIGEPLWRSLLRRRTIAPRPRLEVVFGERVIVDGVDKGSLRSIESHPASSIVLVVTERATVRLTLASRRDALALAAQLQRVRRGAGDRTRADDELVDR